MRINDLAAPPEPINPLMQRGGMLSALFIRESVSKWGNPPTHSLSPTYPDIPEKLGDQIREIVSASALAKTQVHRAVCRRPDCSSLAIS